MRRLRLTLTVSAVTAAALGAAPGTGTASASATVIPRQRCLARLRDKLIKQFSAFSPISTIRVS